MTELSDTPEAQPAGIPPSRKSAKAGLIIILALIALIIGGVAWKITHPTIAKESGYGKHGGGSQPVPVTIQSVGTTNFPVYLDGLGTVQAYNSAQVNARVPGLIQEVLFKEGQDVKAGDVLARIDPRSYQAQYDQAVSKLAQDSAQLESAKILLSRDRELLDKNVLDHQTYDTQRYLVAQLEGTVQADRANIDLQKSQLDWTSVTAPIPGRTGVRLVDVGNQVSSVGNAAGGAAAIVTINQIQPIYIAFTLPQQDLRLIREAQAGTKELPVIALEGNNRTLLCQGVLGAIDNQIDTATSTVKLKAVFTNNDEKLWPGQFVNVRLLLSTKSDAIAVPAQAVQLGPDGAYVYLADQDGTASMRSVRTGATEGGMTLIESGLKVGDQIITDGQYRLQPGSKIVTAGGRKEDGGSWSHSSKH